MEGQKHLNKEEPTLFTALESETSEKGLLHNLFMEIEQMNITELEKGSSNLLLNFNFYATLFDKVLIASSSKGICYLAFADEQQTALRDLKLQFPNATFSKNTDEMHQTAISFLNQDFQSIAKIKLHLKGTDFQLKVWGALLKIKRGQLVCYGEIAKAIAHPKASRAVGTAIGSNLIAFLIPCHRVIQLSGKIGGYRWGVARKSAIIRWELAHKNSDIGR